MSQNTNHSLWQNTKENQNLKINYTYTLIINIMKIMIYTFLID